MSSSSDLSALVTAITHLTAAKYYATASFVMLTYDILITLSWEFDKIWKKKHYNGLTLLWTLNRWVFWFAVVPTVVSFHDASWVGKSYALQGCDGYFRYPGYIATGQRVVIGAIFILRLYAIYNRSLWAPALAAAFLSAEVITKLYATIVWGIAVALPPGIPGCILSVSTENSIKFMFFYVTELWTDAVVVALTIYRSYAAFRATAVRNRTTRLWKVILKDGLAYFVVIFSTNLVTVVMYASASADLKAVNSDFGVMINSIMVARLILNLKAVATFDEDEHDPDVISSANATGVHTMTMTAWEVAVLGELGNELTTGFTSEHSRTVRDSLISMESFGKVDDGAYGAYGDVKGYGGKGFSDAGSSYPVAPPSVDASRTGAPKAGYGSYMYGYTDNDEAAQHGREAYPPPASNSFMHTDPANLHASGSRRPTSAGTSTASHAPLLRTAGLTSQYSISEFGAASPTLENSDIYESFAPPKNNNTNSNRGWNETQYGYEYGAEGASANASSYVGSPIDYVPAPPQQQRSGRAPRPLPSLAGRQMGG